MVLACSVPSMLSAFMPNLPDSHRHDLEEPGKGLAPGWNQRKPHREPKSFSKCLIMTPLPASQGTSQWEVFSLAQGVITNFVVWVSPPIFPKEPTVPVACGTRALVLRLAP